MLKTVYRYQLKMAAWKNFEPLNGVTFIPSTEKSLNIISSLFHVCKRSCLQSGALFLCRVRQVFQKLVRWQMHWKLVPWKFCTPQIFHHWAGPPIVWRHFYMGSFLMILRNLAMEVSQLLWKQKIVVRLWSTCTLHNESQSMLGNNVPMCYVQSA